MLALGGRGGGIGRSLEAWLEHPPEFDPEGWALPLFGVKRCNTAPGRDARDA
jgi:hypothetical protein